MSGKSLIFGEADRDGQGRIAARSLADMLPAEPASAAQPSAPHTARTRAAQLSAAGLVGLAVLIALFALARPLAAPAQPQPTAAATAQPSAQPAAAVAPTATAAPSGCVLVRTTVAYYAPAGDPAPLALERGAACQVVAWHSGQPDWRQIRVGEGAPLWVPLAALSEASAAGLPDLAPPPTPTAAPATATPIVIVREVAAPPPPPEPTRCASYSGGGVSVERCGGGSIEQLQAAALAAWKERMKP